jgi:hypothetical protein
MLYSSFIMLTLEKFPGAATPQEHGRKDVNFVKFAKNSGTTAEKLLLSRRITERNERFC